MNKNKSQDGAILCNLLPSCIKLGLIGNITIDKILKIYYNGDLENRLLQYTEGNKLKTSSQNYIEITDEDFFEKYSQSIVKQKEISRLLPYNNILEYDNLRVASMKPNCILPEHIDDTKTYRFIIMLKGRHIFRSEGTSVEMKARDVWFINPAKRHAIENSFLEERVALLGSFEISNNTTEYLLRKAQKMEKYYG
jgi:quercetin dioxygenase-like cupin family protein